MNGMNPEQALNIMWQVKAKFIGSGADHDSIGVSLQVLQNVVTDYARLQKEEQKRIAEGTTKEVVEDAPQ